MSEDDIIDMLAATLTAYPRRTLHRRVCCGSAAYCMRSAEWGPASCRSEQSTLIASEALVKHDLTSF